MNEFMPNFGDPQVHSALKKLVLFSFAIIATPLGSMFFLKNCIFEGLFHWSSHDSIIYSAIIAVGVVHVVLASFVFVAWHEGRQKSTTVKQD
ncbi:unnamed protein product [Soboliphyme baturini]|uniref:Vacuolar ATPase assembly integral membrane protein VMA21 homolog n=1 Tax=Soboliphyme baturini TaxID=241478 RepID=A0A183IBZ2_9BILA|nr:unnamed protein product [Soboliphyme baturini]